MRLFISYKREYQEFAEKLYQKLDSWGYDTWIDVREMSAGDPSWYYKIDAALNNSDALIGVATREIQSEETGRMVTAEWELVHIERKRPLILIKLQRDAKLPYPFNTCQYIDDFTIDESAGFQKLRTALLKLQEGSDNSGIGITPPELDTTGAAPQNDIRTAMLNKVYQTWIAGVYEQAAQHNEFQIGLAPPALTHSKRYASTVIPPDDSLEVIFRHMGRQMLILGAPGAGKTFLMLKLASELIEQARRKPNHKIPVILNLSSWADWWREHPRTQQRSLDYWLVDSLRIKYRVPRKTAKDWLDNNDLTLLFDGLDEVKADYRDACVEAINDFRANYHEKSLEMVVCSRSAEYAQLQRELDLTAAIELQPLTPEQIDGFLAHEDLCAVRAVVAADPVLQEMVRTPFLLNSIAYTYSGMLEAEMRGCATLPARYEHLFHQYTEKRLKAQPGQSAYTVKATRDYLAWLAQRMVDDGVTDFYIETMQPDWLATPRERRLYHAVLQISTCLPLATVYGIALALDHNQTLGLARGLAVGASAFVAAWVIFWLLLTRSFRPINGAMVGVCVSVVALLAWGPLAGLTIGPALGLLWAVLGGRVIREPGSASRIETVDALRWSWRNSLLGLLAGVIMGAIIGGVFMLVELPREVGSERLSAETALSGGLAWGVAFGMVFGLRLGLVGSRIVDVKSYPNQGIHVSARNAITVGLTTGPLFGLIVGIIWWLRRGVEMGVLYGFTALWVIGLGAALIYGGFPVVQHLLLRTLLNRSGKTPRKLAQFLDFCAERLLLRKVGGGYIFIHRFLQEYFAGRRL